MKYQEPLDQYLIAISTSESPDMQLFGLSDAHLRDATVEIARHMLALGARLAYGGDLRKDGFSDLLFELVARHRRDTRDEHNRSGVVNYLAWPVHALQEFGKIEQMTTDLSDTAELVCLTRDGARMSMQDRRQLVLQPLDEADWSYGLTAMRRTMLADSHARIVLGGRVDQFKGCMPGIAEEALLSLQAGQPLFLIGGFGGCARDIAESLGLVPPRHSYNSKWPGQDLFIKFSEEHLNNGLTAEENMTLARTPHIDQAIILILRGLLNTLGTDEK